MTSMEVMAKKLEHNIRRLRVWRGFLPALSFDAGRAGQGCPLSFYRDFIPPPPQR
ncbi:MAG: hypothetical protein LBJ35_06715 [Spirochaetaceae bacterium]|nr:hypothetical protein [Spirochaetaceae bacterium]